MSLTKQQILNLIDTNPFLTDGGMETCLIYHHGLDLPEFASFPLLRTEGGRGALRRYFSDYLDIAAQSGLGFILDTPTWRASAGWGARLGLSAAEVDQINADAVAFCRDLAESSKVPTVLVNGVVGPEGDGYAPDRQLSVAEAQAYHSPQVKALAGAGPDVISAITMTHAEEAIGITRAAQDTGLPVVVSFTVETDGRLPSGQSLKDAIEEVDAATGNAPAYYMINCAHPDHFADVLTGDAGWLDRIRGVRANASRCSHAELDAATELDDGNPVELGTQITALKTTLRKLAVTGGCCGTDHRHIAELARNSAPVSSAA